MTIISHNHHLVYIHIPKCGGSSVEAAAQKHVRWGDYVVGSTMEGEILHKVAFRNLYGLTKHSTAREVKAVLGDRFAGMKVAATVREPMKVVESFYKFSKNVQRGLVSMMQKQTPTASVEEAQRRAMEALRSGMLDKDPRFDVLVINGGAVKAGMLSRNFEEFLERVADQRWSSYFADYLLDTDGTQLVSDLLRLEDTEGLQHYFRTNFDQAFQLGHENASAKVDTRWPDAMRRTFIGLTAKEYQLLGYPPPA